MDIKKLLLKIVRYTPIISGLPDVKFKDHRDALKETGVTIVLATLPVWLGAFIAALVDKSIVGDVGLLDLILSKLEVTANSGVLILYAASLVSPVIYMALSDVRDGRGKFPSRISHVMAVLMISVIAAGYYTASELAGDLNSQLVKLTSIVLFSCAFFVLYLASCYRNGMSYYDHASVVNRTADDFAQKFRSFRDGRERDA